MRRRSFLGSTAAFFGATAGFIPSSGAAFNKQGYRFRTGETLSKPGATKWYRTSLKSGKPELIPGASGPTYTVRPEDEFHLVQANSRGRASVVLPAKTPPKMLVSLHGAPNVGDTLYVKADALSGYPLPRLTYQWQIDGSPLPDEDQWYGHLTLREEFLGRRVSVIVFGTNSQGQVQQRLETHIVGPKGTPAKWGLSDPTVGMNLQGLTYFNQSMCTIDWARLMSSGAVVEEYETSAPLIPGELSEIEVTKQITERTPQRGYLTIGKGREKVDLTYSGWEDRTFYLESGSRVEDQFPARSLVEYRWEELGKTGRTTFHHTVARTLDQASQQRLLVDKPILAGTPQEGYLVVHSSKTYQLAEPLSSASQTSLQLTEPIQPSTQSGKSLRVQSDSGSLISVLIESFEGSTIKIGRINAKEFALCSTGNEATFGHGQRWLKYDSWQGNEFAISEADFDRHKIWEGNRVIILNMPLALEAAGYTDENGNLTALPENANKAGHRSFLKPPDSYWGERFVVSWAGRGDVEVNGKVSNKVSEGNNRFSFTSDGPFFVSVRQTQPSPNHVRDLKVVRSKYLENHERGEVFSPENIAFNTDVRQVRFMNRLGTNGSEHSRWHNRIKPGARTGAALEDHIDYANRIMADPWFCIPHLADNNYITKFAELVRDRLDPSLTPRFEYSNEVWNRIFPQWHFALSKGREVWPNRDWPSGPYYSLRSTEMAYLIQQAYGVGPKSGKIRIVFGQHAVRPRTAQLEGKVWSDESGGSFYSQSLGLNLDAPHKFMDEVAVTGYFGIAKMAQKKSELAQAYREGRHIDYLFDQLMSPENPRSVPNEARHRIQWKKIAEKFGLKLTMYEGGQHIIYGNNISEADGDAWSAVLDFQQSEELAEAYELAYRLWRNEIGGDGPFVQFSDIGNSSGNGFWQISSAYGKTTKYGEFLRTVSNVDKNWWGGEGNYQHF